MATYKDFESFVRRKYPVIETKDAPGGLICIEVPCGQNRSHLVFIGPGFSHEKQGDFANVIAMFGKLSAKKLEKALEAVLVMPLGGLIKIGDVIALRHGIPLSDVDESEILAAVLNLAYAADTLEEELVGGDQF